MTAGRGDLERALGARLAIAFENLGPAYVKVGQFLATRPDIIGVTAAQDLGRLKDRLPAFSRERALDTINAELGARVESADRNFTARAAIFRTR